MQMQGLAGFDDVVTQYDKLRDLHCHFKGPDHTYFLHSASSTASLQTLGHHGPLHYCPGRHKDAAKDASRDSCRL